MKLRIGELGLLLGCIATAVVVVVAPSEGQLGELTSAGCDQKLRSSATGERVLVARLRAPGSRARARIRFRLNDCSPARVSLRRRHLRDIPGSNGGHLDERLIFRLVQFEHLPKPRGKRKLVLYDGPLLARSRFGLGVWDAGERRGVKMALRFPSLGHPTSTTGGDNAYQGSRVSFDLFWRTSVP